MTQNVIEKQTNDVTLDNKLAGGLLAESQQNENAVIKVANKKIRVVMKIKCQKNKKNYREKEQNNQIKK